jgi:hypothetical protein
MHSDFNARISVIEAKISDINHRVTQDEYHIRDNSGHLSTGESRILQDELKFRINGTFFCNRRVKRDDRVNSCFFWFGEMTCWRMNSFTYKRHYFGESSSVLPLTPQH